MWSSNCRFTSIKIKTTTPDQRKAMVQGRVVKKLTQKDPANQIIRLAPTQVKNSDLKKAMDLFVTAVCLAG